MLKGLLSAITGIPQNTDDDDVQELWQYQKLIDELDIDDSADHPDDDDQDDEPTKKWWQL
jgi:hypothetical protein